jgi:hypothetical protein
MNNSSVEFWKTVQNRLFSKQCNVPGGKSHVITLRVGTCFNFQQSCTI